MQYKRRQGWPEYFLPFPFPAPWEHILMPLRIILLTNFDYAMQFLLGSVSRALCYVSEHSTMLRLSHLWSALKFHPDVFSKLCLVQFQSWMNSPHLNLLRDHRRTPNNVLIKCTMCIHSSQQCVLNVLTSTNTAAEGSGSQCSSRR